MTYRELTTEGTLEYGDCGDLEAIRRANAAQVLANFRLAAELFDPKDMSADDIVWAYRAISDSLEQAKGEVQ